ncbi:MAG: hypothetical protein ABJA02_16865 [Acidobacteriota bacterium]
MSKNIFTHLCVVAALMLSGWSCSNVGDNSRSNDKPSNLSKPEPTEAAPVAVSPVKLQTYSIKGIKFAYYRIDAGLRKEQLIATAQHIHQQEPDTQIILVDDDSQLADYISYVKAISGVGKLEKPLPVEWADKHIIANVQKQTSGKFVLCEGNGSIEITDLK